jgi:hypothetical protein
MVRRRVAWAIALPLAVGSWLGAHCLAYVLVSPGAEHHTGLHAEHGHAYLVWGFTLVLAGLVLCVGEGLRGRRPSRPPVRLFAVLPPIGFTVQEHLEQLVGSGAVRYDLVLEPTFLVGLALQLPFSLAALLLTRALYALGFGLGRVLARRLALRQPPRCAPPSRLHPPAATMLVTPSVLATGHGPRAPPAASCS